MSEELVILEHFRFPYRAHILKARLEEAGIECFVDENSALGIIDGTSVRVKMTDFDNAKQIFEIFEMECCKND